MPTAVPTVECYIGIGSNLANELGTPVEHIKQALQWLNEVPAIENLTISSLYQTKPMGVLDQPDFINAVAKFDTTLSALDLLDLLQALEQRAKRVRLRHWGERSLDLDLLLYGDATINHARLQVPHPGLLLRDFVLIPLLEISPNLMVNGIRLSTLPASQLTDNITRYQSA